MTKRTFRLMYMSLNLQTIAGIYNVTNISLVKVSCF